MLSTSSDYEQRVTFNFTHSMCNIRVLLLPVPCLGIHSVVYLMSCSSMTSARALKGFKEDIIKQQEAKQPNQSLWSGLNHAIIHHFHEFLFLMYWTTEHRGNEGSQQRSANTPQSISIAVLNKAHTEMSPLQTSTSQTQRKA